ncbi:VWA domain-containing protein [Algiphilus sp. W345]|uniref:VWA domain-containing protein n=1 Tax=Banduia mediterranea TaxID=3075609 RepID=A0ABU2WMZ7_9GAMM|nr:VWA domain-containing protein [Algiphilus sp. W345]MDT0499236.1 VWA domain-containing protein [Algiphilus sp. W345]
MSLAPMLQDFHFLRPAWLLALPLLWGLSLWLARRRGRDGDWSRLIDPELLAGLQLEGAATRGGLSPWPLLALLWTLAVLALAGPAWEQESSPAFRGSAAWIVILDLSPSMTVADLSPDRVTRARYAVDDVLAAAHDARVGLVVFSEEAYTVTPLTSDVATVRSLLSPLEPAIMPTRGDQLAPALDRAAELLAGAAASEQRVIVISDGYADPAAAFASASRLRAKGVKLSVLGVGTPGGAPLPGGSGGFVRDAQGNTALARFDPEALQGLATAAGGRYRPLSGLADLTAELADQQSPVRGGAATDMTLSKWRDAGIWLLPVLLVLAALFGRRGWL